MSGNMSVPALPAPKPKFLDINLMDCSNSSLSQKDLGIPSSWISLRNFWIHDDVMMISSVLECSR
jgi:7,8-dihydro-6-hydroxymethylpterin-pyrophosphokinase